MKRIIPKRFLWPVVLLCILVVAGVAIFRILHPPLISFTYYEPSYLPPHTSIKEKRISIIDGEEGYSESAGLNFRTGNWVYSIHEFSAKKVKDPIGAADQNYDEKSVKQTCSILKTPKGMRYRLCHWIDYGTIDVHEVKFIKGTTYIDAQIPGKLSDSISIDEISKFVDSFEKKSTDGVPVQRSKYFG